MGIVATEGSDFEPIPVGLHRAICINVFDIGYQPGYQGGPSHHQIVILWEIEPRDETTGKRFAVSKFYTLNIGDKSNLGADLVSWRTKAFTKDELEGFDLDNIIGKPCQLNIVPNKNSPGKVKVGGVLPRAMATDPVTQKPAPTKYWTPELGRDFVPKFVTKMVAEQLPPPAVKSKTVQTVTGPDQGDGFTDDIPF